MVLYMNTTVAKISEILGLNETELINKSLHEFLEYEIASCDAEIIKLKTKYNVKSAKDMEAQYRRGELDEENSWEDFFKLDHLETKRRKLSDPLKELQ